MSLPSAIDVVHRIVERERARRRCDCTASRHGPEGCREVALVHPEDSSLPMPCDTCAPFEATGLHAGDFPRQLPPMTRDDLEAMAADHELVADEFHGLAPGEITEMYGS